MSYTVTKSHHFCYGHRLLNYNGKCHHLHGHSGRADITLRTDALDSRGLSYDFFEIKEKIGKWIDDTFDHKMLLEKSDPIAELLASKKHTLCLIDCPPTAENIARMIYTHAKESGLPIVSVTLWESDNSWARFEP